MVTSCHGAGSTFELSAGGALMWFALYLLACWPGFSVMVPLVVAARSVTNWIPPSPCLICCLAPPTLQLPIVDEFDSLKYITVFYLLD